MREWPDCSNRPSRSPSVVVISTASMSALGTITSSTRTSRSRRMLLSMARSPGEKAPASLAVSASASAISSRSEVPLRCRKSPSTRWKSDGPADRCSTAPWPGAVLGPGSSSDCSEALITLPASGRAAISALSFIVVRSIILSVLRVGIGNGKPRQCGALQPLHLVGFRVGLVVVAEQMQQAMDHEMGDVVLQRLVFQYAFARHRLRCQNDIAQHGRHRTVTGGWKRRKRQDIGRLVLAAPAGVERLDMRIVGKD